MAITGVGEPLSNTTPGCCTWLSYWTGCHFASKSLKLSGRRYTPLCMGEHSTCAKDQHCQLAKQNEMWAFTVCWWAVRVSWPKGSLWPITCLHTPHSQFCRNRQQKLTNPHIPKGTPAFLEKGISLQNSRLLLNSDPLNVLFSSQPASTLFFCLATYWTQSNT